MIINQIIGYSARILIVSSFTIHWEKKQFESNQSNRVTLLSSSSFVPSLSRLRGFLHVTFDPVKAKGELGIIIFTRAPIKRWTPLSVLGTEGSA